VGGKRVKKGKRDGTTNRKREGIEEGAGKEGETRGEKGRFLWC
jgi:hypothetical protein